MSRFKNVVPFPSDHNQGHSLKVFAMLFYLFVAFMLTLGGQPTGEGLWTLMILGVLFNYMVLQRLYRTSYFKDNRVMLIIVLLILILVYKFTVLLVMGMAVLYWLLVGRSGREAPYFLKFHMLTALIFNFFLLMPYLILNSAVNLVSRCLTLFHLAGADAVVGSVSHTILPLFVMGLMWGAAIWLSINVLMGRTPYFAVITDNVRNLV
jgi:hypothetical protein